MLSPAKEAYLKARNFALRKAKKLRDYALYAAVVWHIRGDASKPYRLDGWDYLREPMNLVAPYICIQASAQCGKTELAMIRAVADTDWGKNVIYAFEIDSKAEELVTERVNPNLAADPYFRTRCADVDNVHQKKIGKGFLYFRGAQTERQATSTSADTLIRDEYDLMPKNVAALYAKRLNASKDPTIIDISNPTFPEVGINERYLASDMRKWHVTCKHCKVEAALEWATHVTEEGLVLCPTCRKPVDRLGPGRWKPTNPRGKHPGYHIHSLMSQVCNVKAVVDDCNSTDSFRKQASIRMDKGDPFIDKTSGLDFQDIKNAAGDWKSREIAPGGYMAVDPGGKFDVQIYEKDTGDGVQRCVWAGFVEGFTELAELERSSGVVAGVIDAGPETDGAKTWCNQRGGRWKRASYTIHDAAGGLWKPDVQAHWIHVNRTALADKFVESVRSKTQLFPSDQACNEASRLAKHLKAPKRIVQMDKQGNFAAKWLHDESQPDHQFHCGMYALLVPLVVSKAGGKAKSHAQSDSH